MIHNTKLPRAERFEAIRHQLVAAETYSSLLRLHDVEAEQRYIERAMADLRRQLASEEW